MSFLYKPVVNILRKANVYDRRIANYSSTICSLLDKAYAEPILDIGTGAGHIANMLCMQGFTFVVGLDIDRNSVKSNKVRLFHPVLADAHHMPFRDGVFGVTLSISCIEHLDSPLACINEIGRISKQLGVCIIQLPNLQWLVEPHTKFPFLYFLPRSFSSLIKKSTRYSALNLDVTLKKVLSWFSDSDFVNIRRIKTHHVLRISRLLPWPLGWFLIFLKLPHNAKMENPVLNRNHCARKMSHVKHKYFF